MAEYGKIRWYAPDPRAILPLDQFHVSRRLARTVRQKRFEVAMNRDFTQTMRHCAARASTWIDETLIEVYTKLHMAGFAHSVECWQAGQMVGGLYGVSVGGLFAGESMFSTERDASKVALVHLVDRLNARGFTLLDTQFTTSHLEKFGVIEIPRATYEHRLAAALQVDARFD